MLKQRDTSIDALKGLAIIGVVTIHCTAGGNIFVPNIFLGAISKYCVPLFIFLSGYLIFKSKQNIKNNFRMYLKRRAVKVYLPYFLITCLICIIEHDSFIKFIKKLLMGTASVPYYFIIVIFQLYLLSKITLFLYERCYKTIFILSILMILSCSITFYIQIYLYRRIVIPYPQWNFINYYIWFILGIEFSAKGKLYMWLNEKKYFSKFIFLVSLLCCLFEVFMFRSHGIEDGNYIAFSPIIWEFSSIVFLWQKRNMFKKYIFIKLGNYSFEIFLIHYPLFQLFLRYFGRNKIPQYSLLYIIFTLIISVVLLDFIVVVKNKVKYVILG